MSEVGEVFDVCSRWEGKKDILKERWRPRVINCLCTPKNCRSRQKLPPAGS